MNQCDSVSFILGFDVVLVEPRQILHQTSMIAEGLEDLCLSLSQSGELAASVTY